MADFLILSDYPAIADNKRSLNDNHGRRLWALLYSQGFPREDSAVEFLFTSAYDIPRKRDKWREIENKHKPKVILALGQDVCKVLGIEGKISDIRGSVIRMPTKRECYVIPTFNPRELAKPMRLFADEPLAKSYFTAGDIKRAVRTYEEGWDTPEERFNLEPTLPQVRQFVEDSIREQRLLGMDLETTGLSIEHGKIFVMGFAWSESDAIVVPILTEGGRQYWSNEEFPEIIRLMTKLFNSCKFMFQNGVGFDVPMLRARGWDFPLSSFSDDTMILHHVLSPELPHKIGFISSQYGKQPFWKDVFIHRKVTIDKMDQIEMRRYNARDCVALHQINNGMLQDMHERMEDPLFIELPNVYKREMDVARVVIRMFEQGIRLDPNRLASWRKQINEEVLEKEGRLRSLAELPASFNFRSTDQMRLLLYGERPAGTEKVLEELALYEKEALNYQYECSSCGRKITKKFYTDSDIPQSRLAKCPGCKGERLTHRTTKEPSPVKSLSKDTNKYRELLDREDMARTAPLRRPSDYKPLETKTEKSAVNQQEITRFIIHVDRRLEALKGMRRKLESHEREEKDLTKTRAFLVAYSEFTEAQELLSTFTEFPTWSDGKVRPSYLVTGTATGRFSCKSPNLQNIPSGARGRIVRSVFRADPEYTLVSVDFGALEVEIAARIIGDDVLLKQLETGLNVHDENTKTFFGVEKSDPNWKSLRDASKVIQFARLLYGGSDEGIFSKVITEVPDSGLTLKFFKEAIRNYIKAHPKYAEWVEKVQTLARERRLSPNAFGRVRILLGDDNSNQRVALNNPVQGSGADIVASDMVELDKYFINKNLQTKIILQVHDELVFHVPMNELKSVSKKIHEVMTREREINGYKFRIPIDAEIGERWGELKKYNLLTGEIEGGSKH